MSSVHCLSPQMSTTAFSCPDCSLEPGTLEVCHGLLHEWQVPTHLAHPLPLSQARWQQSSHGPNWHLYMGCQHYWLSLNTSYFIYLFFNQQIFFQNFKLWVGKDFLGFRGNLSVFTHLPHHLPLTRLALRVEYSPLQTKCMSLDAQGRR